MEDKIELEGIFENGYGIISKKIMQDNSLSIYAKAIYSYLCSFSGKGRDAFPSRNKICYDLNVSSDTLTKYIRELKDRKIIDIKQEKNNGKFSNNVYRINLTLPLPKSSDTVSSCTESSVTVEMDTNNNNITNNNKFINNKEEKENIIKEKFEAFWKEYPKKLNRAKALAWFKKNCPSDELFNIMLQKLQLFKKTKQWQKDNGQFIPYATTWLNQKRWEDDLQLELQEEKLENKEPTPEWIDKKVEKKEASEEARKEIEEMLNEFKEEE